MKIKNKIILILFIFLFLQFIFILGLNPFFKININNDKKNDSKFNFVNPKIASQIHNLTFIHIDNNWTDTESTYDWCNGSGTWEDPFIIENVNISSASNKIGILVNNSNGNYFIIRNSIISNSTPFSFDAGLKLENVNNGMIINVNISNNNFGLILKTSHNNSIAHCNITNNNYGVYFSEDCENNTIYENKIYNNNLNGVNISTSDCKYTLIYSNYFNNNTVNAIDNGENNKWHNNSLGNYWHDYNGKDIDDDGIGDTSYILSGDAGNEDSYPIWWDAPILNIIGPINYSIFGQIPPSYSVAIVEGVNHSWWYTINSEVTKYMFNNNGSINSGAWSGLSNGSHTITFYVNDSKGYENSKIIRIYKDIETPSIDIISPVNYTRFGHDTFNFTIIILESNLNSTWYTINNKENIYFNGITGQNQEELSFTEWNKEQNGSVVICFYANDSVGNLGSANVTVYKDIIGPDISITEPDLYDVFGTTAPNCTINFDDINGINQTWYHLSNGTFTTANRSWTGLINVNDWVLMSNGTVTIIFYANDSVGNIATANVTIYKDIIGPDILIDEPDFYEVFGTIPPICLVDFDDINGVNQTWYHLSNGTFTTANRSWTGSIDVNDWILMPNGTVTIIFYANDSVGNIRSATVTVYKDVIGPDITISEPDFYEVFGTIPPICLVDFDDINGVNQTWYHLSNGTFTTANRSWTGSIDVNDWILMPNGTVTIIFYANDSVGNIATANVTIYKDIIGPDITISEPDSSEVFGTTPPICLVDFDDINGINQTWYQLTNGTFTTDNRLWTDSIDVNDWALMPNGTVTIIFYANDSVGNIGSSNVTVYKDIIGPDITISEPDPYEVFG
ncbi:MAG: right-handed parallel beta-helix repeat-containing protein, partial [Candidatus Heimdallarchaeota archaeon]